MPVVLAPIAVLVLVLWVIAAALAISLIMAKIGDIFRAVPVVGGYIAGATESLAHGIANACGKLEAGVDSLIGAAWHLFARYLDRTWNHMVADAHLGLRLAEAIGGHIYDLSGLRRVVDDLTRAWHGIEHGVKSLVKEWHGIEARVKSLERTIARGIGHDLRIQIKALEREVHGIEKGVIPELRAWIKTAEGEVSQIENFIKAIPGTRYLAWAAGIVAAGLATLGLGWLRCSSNPFNNNKNACGLWGDLSALLGLAFIAAEVASLEELIGVAQTVTEGITQGVEDLLKV